MALFTDTAIVTMDDLLPFEASLVQVASSHGINVDIKVGLAVDSIGEKLMQRLLDVGMSDPQWFSRRVIGLSTVVVTPTLHRWVCFEALSRFFAEAYNTQLNTRFQGKWMEYQQEAKNASDIADAAGIGIVYKPLPKPNLPLVSVQQGGAPAESMFVQVAWVDSTGDEGALSPVNGVLLTSGASISVATSEGALNAPPAALGWNVYVSSNQGEASKQNENPLTIGSTWSLPASGLEAGDEPIDGQSPDFYIPISRQLRRG